MPESWYTRLPYIDRCTLSVTLFAVGLCDSAFGISMHRTQWHHSSVPIGSRSIVQQPNPPSIATYYILLPVSAAWQRIDTPNTSLLPLLPTALFYLLLRFGKPRSSTRRAFRFSLQIYDHRGIGFFLVGGFISFHLSTFYFVSHLSLDQGVLRHGILFLILDTNGLRSSCSCSSSGSVHTSGLGFLSFIRAPGSSRTGNHRDTTFP